MIKWQSLFDVGIPDIDTQHRKLLQMINRLHEAAIQGHAQSEMGSVIRDLVEYTKYHFEEEEHLMKSIKYVEYKHHCAGHAEMIKAIVGVLNHMKDTGRANAFQLVAFLQEWFINHVLDHDKRLGRALVAAADRTVKA